LIIVPNRGGENMRKTIFLFVGIFALSIILGTAPPYQMVVHSSDNQNIDELNIGPLKSKGTNIFSMDANSEEDRYVASRNSNIFHYTWCSHAKSIKPENRIYFKTRDDAINSGRRPCKTCNP